MFDSHPILARFIVFVLVPMLGAAAVLYLYFFDYSPRYSGSEVVQGLSEEVEISFDQYGTPSIRATSDADAYFALGYLHASERMWQLEVQRRVTEGRLSEVFGSSYIDSDIWLRTLGLARAAEQSWVGLDDGPKEALISYRDGVNAWLRNTQNLPIEFRLLGVVPERWEVYDSLAWQKMFALNLDRSLFDEVERLNARRRLPPSLLKTFFPHDPVTSGGDAASNEHRALPGASIEPGAGPSLRFGDWSEAAATLEFGLGVGGRGIGSNAWAVGGRHTASGGAMLANDPHLNLQTPSLWYAAALKGDKLDVAGMSIVGVPAIVFGRNRNIAWGGTNLMSDQQDLFIEQISSEYPNHYLGPDGWEPFKLRTEVIHVRASQPTFLNEDPSPVTIQVRETRHGPVVSDAIEHGGDVLSLRWTALDVEDHTYSGFYHLQYAADWAGFRAAAGRIKSPGINFVYADVEGNIGRQAAGAIPLRRSGRGLVPLRASLAESSWLGYAEFEDLPTELNPDVGYIVSANQEIASKPEVIISHDWASPSRSDRIHEMLSEGISNGTPMTVERFSEMQMDYVDLSAKKLVPLLLAATPNEPVVAESLRLLGEWDYSFSSGSAAASIYLTWRRLLVDMIFIDDLQAAQISRGDRLVQLTARVRSSQLAEVLRLDPHGWCSDAGDVGKTGDTVSCQAELVSSLHETVALLTKLTGSNEPSSWAWGELLSAHMPHQPFGHVSGLHRLFGHQFASAGSANTVAAANARFDTSKGYIQTFGAGFRQIVDMSDPESLWYVLGPGQSGSLTSSHYSDMVDHFRRNEMIRLGLGSRDMPGDDDTPWLRLVPGELNR